MTWDYIAGYFDGEGHAQLCKTGRGNLSRKIVFYNSHRSSLEAIKSFMGVGAIHRDRIAKGGPVYSLTVTRREILLRVLTSMVPHLIVKRAAAERLLANLRAMDATAIRRSETNGRVTAISTEQLGAWYGAQHESCALIAWRLGVTPSAVAMELRRRGMPRRPAGGAVMRGVPKSDETKRRMREAWARRMAA